MFVDAGVRSYIFPQTQTKACVNIQIIHAGVKQQAKGRRRDALPGDRAVTVPVVGGRAEVRQAQGRGEIVLEVGFGCAADGAEEDRAVAATGIFGGDADRAAAADVVLDPLVVAALADPGAGAGRHGAGGGRGGDARRRHGAEVGVVDGPGVGARRHGRQQGGGGKFGGDVIHAQTPGYLACPKRAQRTATQPCARRPSRSMQLA